MKKLKGLIIMMLIASPAISQTNLMDVKPWAYWLQDINIQTIVNDNSFELIVMDYSPDGSDESKFSLAQIDSVKNSGKYAISYISVGEAEDYRYYWDNAWTTTPPSWLGPENPDWAGNYKVRFWESQWQDIVFDYIDTIIHQGFDGIYLDIIDAYYYWSEENPEKTDADKLMCEFIVNIRNHVDSKTGNNTFIIIPQNGEDVYDQTNVTAGLKDSYFNAINAIGVEDVFFQGSLDEDNPFDPDTYRIGILTEYLSKNKQVYSVEYLTQIQKINQYKNAASTNNFIPYVCTRALDNLCGGISTGLIMTESNANEDIIFYPNPTQNNLTVSIKQNQSNENSRLTILNSNGKVVKEYILTTSLGDNINLDLSELTSGIYFIKFSNTQISKVSKLSIIK